MFAILHKRCLLGIAVLMLSSSLAVAQETPAEKIRKALEQNVTLNYSGNDLQDVINHVRDKTGIKITIDPAALNGMQPFGIPPGALGPPPIGSFEIKSEGGKLKTALRKLVQGQNLTYVVLENSLQITIEDLAVTRQLTQRINVNVSDVPLQKALKDLTRSTPMNLIIDPRIVKEAQNPVSLELDGITAETAVRLLTELGGLKTVRVDNVLFVTDEARAEKMRKEQPPVTPGPAIQYYAPPPAIGFGIAPPGAGLGLPPVQVQAVPAIVQPALPPPPGVAPPIPVPQQQSPQQPVPQRPYEP